MKVRRFVAMVRPGPSRHRAAVYYVEAANATWARRWLRENATPAPSFIRLRDVTGLGSVRRHGVGVLRIPPIVRLWSVE